MLIDKADPSCRIELLGPLRVIQNARIITRFPLQKAAFLLAYLALPPHRLHSREQLIDLLWPELDEDAGRTNLNTTLTALRRELEPAGVPRGSLLATDRQTVGLHSERIRTDVAEFDALLAKASNAAKGNSASNAAHIPFLEAAAALYRGDLMEGCYEEWALTAQTAYRVRFQEALVDMANGLEQQGQWEAAQRAAERATQLNPLSEEATLLLMRALARQGHTSRAIETYRLFQTRLHDELNVAPTQELRQLMESLQRDPDTLTMLLPSPPERYAIAVEPEVGAALASPYRQSAPSSLTSQPQTDKHDMREPLELEPAGGAVPLPSPFYIVRPVDALFQQAIQRRDSIVLIKGPGQVGKTSLLARGLHQARQHNATIILTDLQNLNRLQWSTSDLFYQGLAQNIADQLDLEADPMSTWSTSRSPNANFERFLRRDVIGKMAGPVVWGLDEVDRLFAAPFRDDVFGLFRSWHNARALDPSAPWNQLTMAIAYATEAHLFITDLNQSPFSVGTRLTMEDFTFDEIVELNRRHRTPLKEAELLQLSGLVGGNPYLVRRGLHEIVTRSLAFETFAVRADQDDGCYGDHLRRMFVSLSKSPDLAAAVRNLIQGQQDSALESLYRLRSAGVVNSADRGFEFRCPIYRSYLSRYMA